MSALQDISQSGTCVEVCGHCVHVSWPPLSGVPRSPATAQRIHKLTAAPASMWWLHLFQESPLEQKHCLSFPESPYLSRDLIYVPHAWICLNKVNQLLTCEMMNLFYNIHSCYRLSGTWQWQARWWPWQYPMSWALPGSLVPMQELRSLPQYQFPDAEPHTLNHAPSVPRSSLSATSTQSLLFIVKYFGISAGSLQVISPLLPSRNIQKRHNRLNMHHKANARTTLAAQMETTHRHRARCLKEYWGIPQGARAETLRLALVETPLSNQMRYARIVTGVERLEERARPRDKAEKLSWDDSPESWVLW